MLRRHLLKGVAALPFATALTDPLARATAASALARRIRPSDPAWPSEESWAVLRQAVGGRLVRPRTVWATCAAEPATPQCLASLKIVHNPLALGDDPGGTQVSGWLDAWTPTASAYAVAVRSSGDVVEAVNFARRNNLRLVVKGGGHSYLGGSNAPESLLIWTRAMNRIELHDAFVPAGCAVPPAPAVTLDAGCMWIDAYTQVTTRAGRYVQGGGCTSVGVAGLIQGGGFGSFSKRYGLAAASLLQAEIVTADGRLRTVNASQDADLFWALQGGGGGSFGVVTRLTLKTHALPEHFGFVGAKIKASTPQAYRRLVARFVAHYAEALCNPHWGEAFNLYKDEVEVSMVCQGLDAGQAKAIWAPFFDELRASPQDFTFIEDAYFGVSRAQAWWDLKSNPAMILDSRRDAAPGHGWWRGDQEQVSMFLHGYDSQWLPASLLQPRERPRLVDALVAASQSMIVRLHFNKGLAGASAEIRAAARRCPTNPAVADAFCLAIVATGGPPPFPSLPGPKPDMAEAHRNARNVAAASTELKRVAPEGGSYISETDFFRADWRQAFWGKNYRRLKAIKDHCDPDGFFFVHHGVGSEDWSADGFTRAHSA
ncbi:FAD-binding protein [Caulobacter sp. S45]|uniref:FAD-dependent oxidoreductase n=1 Tax=Caulobacter sp. S45 TaxID=1641861 RepID=UPI00131BDFCF|nr:FAD-binding oxidoreductase [Caulobacter sp. S45]